MSRDVERAGSQFFGGRLCLDFANTLDWRTSPQPVELLPDYAALLGWSLRRGTLPRPAVNRLKRKGNARADSAIMAPAFFLRSEIWTICEALMVGVQPKLARCNALLATAPRQPRIMRAEGTFVHKFAGDDPAEPLWPIVWSLSALLTSIDAQRLGMCNAEGCGWFFVDESPNHSRLWCSSEICGNRERARRFYAKRKEVAPGEPKRHRPNEHSRRDG